MEDFSDLIEIDEVDLVDVTPSGRKGLTATQIANQHRARHELFARAYVDNGCDGDAALRAVGMGNYGTKAQRAGHVTRLLAHPHVRDALRRMLEPAIKKANLTLEKTLMQIAAVAQFDKRKLYNEDGTQKHPKDLDEVTAAAISHIGKGDYVPFDKLKALDMSMKYLGAYERDNAQKTPNLAVQVLLV